MPHAFRGRQKTQRLCARSFQHYTLLSLSLVDTPGCCDTHASPPCECGSSNTPEDSRNLPHPLQFPEGQSRSIFAALESSTAVAKVSGYTAALRKHRLAGDGDASAAFYTAPEAPQWPRLSSAADVFAFGVIMWELMQGCLAYSQPCAAPPPAACCVLRGEPACLHAHGRAAVYSRLDERDCQRREGGGRSTELDLQ